MAGEKTTIARPYAEAMFARARDTDKLDLWSEMLAFLDAVVRDPGMAGIIDNPRVGRDRLADLLLDIAGGRLSDEGENLVRVLVANRRVQVLPEIALLFEDLKNAAEGALDVHIVSAYAVNAAQKSQLADALRSRLGKEVRITTEKDPSLIGGAVIRAGDLVIDGSVKGRIRQLATELGI
jgi:F-type H+-transporting ATPase subunit delta